MEQCSFCRREFEDADQCGPHGQEPCPCCGMVIVAQAEEPEIPTEEESE